MAKRDYIESSGNVFADLGLPNPEEMLAKAELAIKIAEILRQRRLTQVQAAAMLGVDQPKVSALIRGRLSGISIERLLLLGTDVSIRIMPRRRPRSKLSTRISKRTGSFPRKGILTIDEIVAGKASRNRRKQQRAA